MLVISGLQTFTQAVPPARSTFLPYFPSPGFIP